MILSALIAMLVQASPPLPGPPPPPPPESNESYDAIDRLAFLEGEWIGMRQVGGGHPIPVAWRVGRLGAGADHLLIEVIEHYGGSAPATFDPRDPRQVMVLSYDALRSGYRVYAPGFFDPRASADRGTDELATLVLKGDGLTWTMPISSQRELTVKVVGDQLEETLTYLPDRSTIYHATLRRTPTRLLWGEPSMAPNGD